MLQAKACPIRCYHALGGGMLQAGLGSDSRVRLGLSGVTPGEREELRFRRVSDPARYADRLTPGKTRWSIPPSFTHVEAVALDRTCQGLSRRRTDRGTGDGARHPGAWQTLALASALGPTICEGLRRRSTPTPPGSG